VFLRGRTNAERGKERDDWMVFRYVGTAMAQICLVFFFSIVLRFSKPRIAKNYVSRDIVYVSRGVCFLLLLDERGIAVVLKWHILVDSVVVVQNLAGVYPEGQEEGVREPRTRRD